MRKRKPVPKLKGYLRFRLKPEQERLLVAAAARLELAVGSYARSKAILAAKEDLSQKST